MKIYKFRHEQFPVIIEIVADDNLLSVGILGDIVKEPDRWYESFE